MLYNEIDILITETVEIQLGRDGYYQHYGVSDDLPQKCIERREPI